MSRQIDVSEASEFLNFIINETGENVKEISKKTKAKDKKKRGVNNVTLYSWLKEKSKRPKSVRASAFLLLTKTYPDLYEKFNPELAPSRIKAKYVQQIIKHLTDERKMTQKGICELAGIKSEATLTNWKNLDPEQDTVLINNIIAILEIDDTLVDMLPDNVRIPKRLMKNQNQENTDSFNDKQKMIINILLEKIKTLEKEIKELKER